jgi:3-phosphoshikimate 1-carboxyvinyltransferase
MLLTARKNPGPLNGAARIPGDKSMSHRALLLGAVAKGETIIAGLLDAADIRATGAALRATGVRVYHAETGLWHVHGAGPEALVSPAAVLDMGNSGTGARLLAGLLTGTDVTATFTGDKSLSKRPMRRVLEPLSRMGAAVIARDDNYMPFTLRGAGQATPIDYELPVPSAQVKSAVLLAGLFADGATIVREPRPTRDHTEIMMRHFGADIETKDGVITLHGGRILEGCALDIPGDPSAAAFVAAAAALTPGSNVKLAGVCINPTRTGFYDVLREMGASVTFEHEKIQGGERVADIRVMGGAALRGITVAEDRIPAMVDEIPVLCAVAAYAGGTTTLRGLAELRVKESDRVALMAKGLRANGIEVTVDGDDMTITGADGPVPGGATVETAMDHRIAMAFLVLGGAALKPVTIDDDKYIGTSFPGFAKLLNGLGADIADGPDYMPAFA